MNKNNPFSELAGKNNEPVSKATEAAVLAWWQRICGHPSGLPLDFHDSQPFLGRP